MFHSPFSPLEPARALSAVKQRIARRSPGSLSAGLVVAAVAASVHAQEPSSSIESLGSFDGDWRRIEVEAGDLARNESIDAATRDLSWIVRRTVSGILRETTAPPEALGFRWNGSELAQRVSGPKGEMERPVGLDEGPRRALDDRGEETTVEWRRTPEGIEVRWKQSRAEGRNAYRVDEDARFLDVDHRIRVTAIAGVDEIRFRSRFRRELIEAGKRD